MLDARNRPRESGSDEQNGASAVASTRKRRGLRILILVILVATVLGLLVEFFQKGGMLREYFFGR